MVSLETLERESLFGPYAEELVTKWGEEKTEKFLSEFTEGCKGCGGCCMNYNPYGPSIGGWRNKGFGSCSDLKEKMNEEKNIIRYECSRYDENRPQKCIEYEKEITENGLVCHPFLNEISKKYAPEILETLYLPSDLDLDRKITRVRDIREKIKDGTHSNKRSKESQIPVPNK
ncbi:MAG: hypothetical protein ABEK17_03040 [Candidatus Aenigmatarchaeota archaeon]